MTVLKHVKNEKSSIYVEERKSFPACINKNELR